MSECANPACKSETVVLAAKGLCWNCYQSQRRSALPKKRSPPCVGGRRNHSYGTDGKCRFCGALRMFNL